MRSDCGRNLKHVLPLGRCNCHHVDLVISIVVIIRIIIIIITDIKIVAIITNIIIIKVKIIILIGLLLLPSLLLSLRNGMGVYPSSRLWTAARVPRHIKIGFRESVTRSCGFPAPLFSILL